MSVDSLRRGSLASDSLVDLLEIELANGRAEVLIVEDLLVDLVVGVDAGHDGLEKVAVEDEAEVVDGVVCGLGSTVRQLAVGEADDSDTTLANPIDRLPVNAGALRLEPVVVPAEVQ